jgi:hypothetical protein
MNLEWHNHCAAKSCICNGTVPKRIHQAMLGSRIILEPARRRGTRAEAVPRACLEACGAQ